MTRAGVLAALGVVLLLGPPEVRASPAQAGGGTDTPVDAGAGERYALIVSGASGDETFAAQYDRWRDALVATLQDRLAFEPGDLFVLTETPAEGERVANRENVREVLEMLGARMDDEDLLLVVLIGHGTWDGVDAKFNLVGPDLEAREWEALLRPLPGRLVFINGASSSHPFLERLAAPGRIVITATDSPAQRFATVFPEFLPRALADPSADIDKDGRVSVWEAFVALSALVRQHYEQRGQLATERPVLDDEGRGVGLDVEAARARPASLAHRTHLSADPLPALTTDQELEELWRRRRALEAELEELRVKRDIMPAADYAAELERILIELARVSREIRERS